MCKKGVNNEYKGGETFYSLLKIKEKHDKFSEHRFKKKD